MALTLNQLVKRPLSFASRDETASVLQQILERQMTLFTPHHADSPVYNSAAHYQDQVAHLEHLCRLLWGASAAGTEVSAAQASLRALIIAGCDPHSEHYWQAAKDYDQRVVEMASIAVALIDAKQTYWLPLSASQRTHLVKWLQSVSDLQLPANNWRWFRILILSALERLNIDINQRVLAEDLAFVDALYLADGWYQDGAGSVLDYYNPFAFQLYGLIYVRWQQGQGDYCERWLARAVAFADGFQYWFADNGQPLCYGRSLNYRFAGAAFWVELARSGHPDVDIAMVKSYWMQTMQWWAQQPIWDHQAQLLPGFAYPNLLGSEFYTSYASPMLAMKAFNALALPSEHPFWQLPAKPLANQLATTWIGSHHCMIRRGGSYLITNGPASAELRHCDDKYSKFAYSSDHGLGIEATRWIEQGWAGDNIFAFAHRQTRQWFSRTHNSDSFRQGDTLVSIWQPFEGCVVTTQQWWTPQGEMRRHDVTVDEALDFIMTGYAVDRWSAWFSHQTIQPARVESEQLFSELELIEGQGESHIYPCAPNSNLVFPHASVPAITGSLPPGHHQFIVMVKAGRK